MFRIDENPKIPELTIGINLLRGENKFYKLPLLRNDGYPLQDGDTVELIFMEMQRVSVETWEYPLRYGRYFGNKIFFNIYADGSSINPKFVFDRMKEVWTLIHIGSVCFAEIELENKSNLKIQGQDA